MANGEVVHNLGGIKCTILVGKDVGELNIAIQVVEVHKPLLSGRSRTVQGRKVISADQDDHILLSSNRKLPCATSTESLKPTFGPSAIVTPVPWICQAGYPALDLYPIGPLDHPNKDLDGA